MPFKLSLSPFDISGVVKLETSLQVLAMLQAGLARSSTGGLEAEGCGITKYSSAHSFNPLLASKSTQNLSVKKVDFSAEKIP